MDELPRWICAFDRVGKFDSQGQLGGYANASLRRLVDNPPDQGIKAAVQLQLARFDVQQVACSRTACAHGLLEAVRSDALEEPLLEAAPLTAQNLGLHDAGLPFLPEREDGIGFR
ncbi:hypothetical protein [Azospirillum argentinense]